MPMVNGAPGADRLPTFATYNASKKSDEEQQPLRAQALSDEPTLVPSVHDAASDRFYGGPPPRSSSQPPQFRPRDQFGNPPPPMLNGAIVPGQGRRSGEEPTLPNVYRDRSAPPPGGRSYSGRGRGSYSSRGGYPPRGGFAPRGPPPPQGYPGRGGFSSEMRGGYTGRGRGGFGPGAAIGAAAAGMAAGAMMAGSRQPPPRYPPSGSEAAPERFTPSEQYHASMGPPLPVDNSQQYVDDNERRIDTRSPSVYTQGDEQGPYGSRAQSPARSRRSPYGSRVQSPAGTIRRPSPPPMMPPLPVNQPAELAGTSTQDWNPRRSQSQDP